MLFAELAAIARVNTGQGNHNKVAAAAVEAFNKVFSGRGRQLKRKAFDFAIEAARAALGIQNNLPI